MSKFKYNEIARKMADPSALRKMIVKFSKENGVAAAAQEYGCHVRTVVKYRARLRETGSLQSLSRRPKTSPLRIPILPEAKIVDFCERKLANHKRIDAAKVKRSLDLCYSLPAIRRVMHEHGFAGYRRRKSQRKRDLRDVKRKLKAFEKIQVDVKYLTDIPEMYAELKAFDLPKFQYSARCLKTGAYFSCYSQQISRENSAAFLYLLASHLKRHGCQLMETVVQTDNGSEFVNRFNEAIVNDFAQVCEKLFPMKHKTIPPGAKTWQSDVETIHRLVEEEFLSFEEFTSRKDFMEKAYKYLIHFNTRRKNSYKDGKTPLEILKETRQKIDPSVMDFRPILLDGVWMKKRKEGVERYVA